MPDFETLSKAQRDAMLKPSKPDSWVSPEGFVELKKAVLAKKHEVVIDGTKYKITYGFRRTYPSSKETIDSVRLNRMSGGFVPMGYFPISKIMAKG